MVSRRADCDGVILIALLWVLTALAVIAFSFSRESFVEVAAARNARDMADGYFIARAGMANTVYQLLERQLRPPLKQLQLEGPPEPIELGHVTGRFADGVFDVDIQDESGKINLNFASEEQLHTLLEVVGIDKREADVIVDSIMDWKDVDKLHRINGAEDEFYQSLPQPYSPKNGRFETVEELLLVRGVTKDYYYGHPEKTQDGGAGYRYGLSRYLTVYTTGNRINVNYAPREVLMSVPGMTPDAANAIFERRSVKPFTNIQEITSDLPVTLGPSTLPFLSTDRTNVYTLTASGRREGSRVRRVVRAVVIVGDRSLTRHTIIYWNENVPNL
jgi:general secretion pathway protein K